jgi:hypothetical protein
LNFAQVGHIFVIISPKIFGRHTVFAFAVCLSILSSVRPSIRIQLVQLSQVKLLAGFQ